MILFDDEVSLEFQGWGDQAVFNRDCNRTDGPMTTHWQAAGCFNKQHTDITIIPRTRVEDTARHHCMPAGFKHQGGSNPVILGHEMLLAVEHALTFQFGTTAVDQANGIAARVGINTMESSLLCHLGLTVDAGHQPFHHGNNAIRPFLGAIVFTARDQARHLGMRGNRIGQLHLVAVAIPETATMAP